MLAYVSAIGTTVALGFRADHRRDVLDALEVYFPFEGDLRS